MIIVYCEKCGYLLDDSAKFCPNCGNSVARPQITAMTEEITDTEIQLIIRPVFKLGYQCMVPLFVLLFFLITSIPTFIYINNFQIICMIGGMFYGFMLFGSAIMLIINKKKYDGTCYDFYKTKVIYRYDFLNFSEKEVKYKHIKEVTMRQSVIQKYFNIGDIILFTNAEAGYHNGIYIHDVENVQQVYKDIKSIIGV